MGISFLTHNSANFPADGVGNDFSVHVDANIAGLGETTRETLYLSGTEHLLEETGKQLSAFPQNGTPAEVDQYLTALNNALTTVSQEADTYQRLAPDQHESSFRKMILSALSAALSALKGRIFFISHQSRPEASTAPERLTDLEKLSNSDSLMRLGRHALTLTPTRPDHLEPLKARLEDIRGAIDAYAASRNDGVLDTNLAALRTNLEKRIGIVTRSKENNPLSTRAFFEGKTKDVDAAISIINDMLAQPLDKTQKTHLGRAKEVLETRKELMGAQTDVKSLTKQEIADIMGGKDSKGKYRSPAEVAKKAPEISASVEAAVASILSNDADPSVAAGLLPLSSSKLGEGGIMQTFLEKLCKEAGIEPDRKLSALYKKAKIQVRNDSAWSTKSNDVQIVVNGKVRDFTINATPQAGIRSPGESGERIFAALTNAEGGYRGIASHDTLNYRNVPSLFMTSMTGNDGKPLFQGIRHATLSPYGITPDAIRSMDREELKEMIGFLIPDPQIIQSTFPDLDVLSPANLASKVQGNNEACKTCAGLLRKAAAAVRARDVALAALAAQPEKWQAAQSGDRVKLDILSISLMTPVGAERVMIADQRAAWEEIRQNGIKVDRPDGPPVRVNVNVVDFNFGVNDGEFLLGASSGGKAFGDRDTARHNAESMAALLGDSTVSGDNEFGGTTGEWLEEADKWLKKHQPADNQTPDADYQKKLQLRDEVNTLASQIRQLWRSEDYAAPGIEPYKLVSRLAALAHKMDMVPAWNCKSGKDRTSVEATEVFHLVSQSAFDSGGVPQPDHRRTDEERSNCFRLATEGVNFGIQADNTGFGGHKIMKTRLPGGANAIQLSATTPANDRKAAVQWFQGGAKHTSS